MHVVERGCLVHLGCSDVADAAGHPTSARAPKRPPGEVVERIRTDTEFASLVAAQPGLHGGVLRTDDELLANDEDFAVASKSIARWDLREN